MGRITYTYQEVQHGIRLSKLQDGIYGVSKKMLPKEYEIVGQTCLRVVKNERARKSYFAVGDAQIHMQTKSIFGITRGYVWVGDANYVQVKRRVFPLVFLLLMLLCLLFGLRGCSPDMPSLLDVISGDDRLQQERTYDAYLDVAGYPQHMTFSSDAGVLELSNPNKKGLFYLQFKLYYGADVIYESDLLDGEGVLNVDVYDLVKDKSPSETLIIETQPYDKNQVKCSVPVKQTINVNVE